MRIFKIALLLITGILSFYPGLAQRADSLQKPGRTKEGGISADTAGKEMGRPRPAIRMVPDSQRRSVSVALALHDSLGNTLVSGKKETLLSKTTDHPQSEKADDATRSYEQFLAHLLGNNRFFTGVSRPVPDFDAVRPAQSTGELLFYVSFGILLLIAVIRLAYYKYFADLVRAFFNPTLSQRQLKEQLSQTPFPSFLLNIFFAVAGGFYFFLVLRHYHYIVGYNPLYLIPAFMLLIGLIYLVKYLFLKMSGWLFGSRELTDGYIFIIYLINKMAGVLLLPFIIIMAFCDNGIAEISLYIVLSFMLLLIAYRYIRVYGLIKNYIYFSKFHFFLYLCAFEIAPILIIGKLVLVWLNGTGG